MFLPKQTRGVIEGYADGLFHPGGVAAHEHQEDRIFCIFHPAAPEPTGSEKRIITVSKLNLSGDFGRHESRLGDRHFRFSQFGDFPLRGPD